jgi:Uma2 family endonuclease
MVVTSKVIMQRANVRFNYDDYLQLPEDKRYEILDGELYVVPAPNTRHQRISKKIETALIRQVEEKGFGEVFHAPYDVVLSAENVTQPDILVVRTERLSVIAEANLLGAPDLVIEVLSPGTREKDLAIKRKIYARFGVQEYWIVDPDAATVEVLTLRESGYISAGMYRESDCLSSPLLPGLVLPLAEVFSTH